VTHVVPYLTVAVAAIALAWAMLSWLLTRLNAIRHEDRADIKEFVGTQVGTLAHSIDGVRVEVSGIRADLHIVNDRTVNHEARIGALERYDVVAQPTPAKKSARKRAA
jgi:hypothetical protein